ncbi:PTS N'-diacetylchitobiose transporter subunit IIB [Buttiauxella gaviniae]|uniref:PTS sugar transporter subunit IIA domain-containing protein n=1 Tax=Buttiauxella gaviniae TaxID=82990 RepID=UPI0039B05ED7
MTIPIVVITHGQSARALCESVQMIIGQQQHLYSVDFLPGENTDSLVTKIGLLPTSPDPLFMVDFLGGSPFNAAAWYRQQKNQGDVITGVNIPMLVNVLLERTANSTLEQLAALAKESGIGGIQQMSLDFKIAMNQEEDL